MYEKDSRFPDRRWPEEGAIAAVSAGLFFVLIGVIVVINLNLWTAIKDFGNDFTTANVGNSSIQLPIPGTPAAHTQVYSVAFQFALGIAILQIIILAMRLTMGSGIRRKAETVGSLVFWFGAAFLLNNLADMKSTLAISQQQTMWFQFWAAIIMLIGFSLIARAVILLAVKQFTRSPIES